MKKQFLLDFLESAGCIIVRLDKKGYHVVENPANGKMSGVPKEDNLEPELVCRICMTLDIRLPHDEKVSKAKELIEHILHKLNEKKKK